MDTINRLTKNKEALILCLQSIMGINFPKQSITHGSI